MNDPKTPISISISRKLLAQIEQNISGDNRSQKIAKCIMKGYEILRKETDLP